MATIRRFEDLEAWCEARALVRAVYTASGNGTFTRDLGLRDQIQRASVSVMSNIAEGFERGGKAEFRRFLAMAKGSAGEVRSQLYVALDGGHLDRPSFDLLYAQTESVSSLIGGPMRYLSHTSHP